MNESTILTRTEGRVAVLTLNRPRVMNAFNKQMMAEVSAAMDSFARDDQVLAVVVHGAGRCFSAGFDMKESAEHPISGTEQWRAALMRDFEFIMQFWDSPKPTIAAVHGYCLGGAFELMLASDMSLAEESALLGEPEVSFGSGIVAMLAPWVTGPKQAKELLLTGNGRMSAQRCYEMNVLNRVVPDGEALASALELAGQVAAAAPNSVQMTKRAINRRYELAHMRQALAEALEIEVEIESDESPERVEFNRIRGTEGLKAALAWRDARATENDG